MIEVLQTVLPVALMLLIGMVCRNRKLISREGVNALKSVVVNIALPAVLLNAFATTRYTFLDVVIPLLMFLVCLAAWALGYALFNMLYGSACTVELARIDLCQALFVFMPYKVQRRPATGRPGRDRWFAGHFR